MKKVSTAIALLIISTFSLAAQDFTGGRISGNFQLDAQSYAKDSLIGADEVPEQVLAQGYLNLLYQAGNFEAGIRYENYMNPILGFDSRLQDQGIAYRFASYKSDFIDLTAGDFYEQFGSGMIFRAYEERALGFDNAVDGVRVKLRPANGVEITGLLGKQRVFWKKSDGIIRGGDINIFLNDLIPGIMPDDYFFGLGGSVVSRYQQDRNSQLILPENVLSWSSRFSVSSYSFAFDAEYGHKYNDPNINNEYSYNDGRGIILTGSYFTSGFGLALNAHWIDNMDFRSDRNARGTELTVGFVPPLTKQHTYALAAVYPYATQFNGEAGVQAEVTYKIPRKTTLGGRYGTDININFSSVKSIDTVHINEYEYESNFLGIGDDLFFRDINIDITRRWSKDIKMGLTFLNMIYDRDVMENEGAPYYGKVNSNVVILDLTKSFNDGMALRGEFQHLWAKQDSAVKDPDNVNGDWLQVLFEFTVAPNWYLTFYDQWNYGNDDEARQIHYLNASVAYVTGTTRVQVGYGKQRSGILCVGGVCRVVPASNGFNLSISSSF
jgi:hypothetical protein